MLKTILNLFGRSPFSPLQSHMEKVESCVHLLPELFDSLEKKEFERVDQISEKISFIEHQADLLKNDIRNHLPKSLYLPIDRAQLLEILALQDNIADRAQDIGILCSLKKMEILERFKPDFKEFLRKNIESFHEVSLIIKELHELVETSFGGVEAQKVRVMVEEVATKEHEADVIQRKLLKGLFAAEEDMTYSTFFLWQKIFEALGSIANLSEKLAYRVRMTLEPKK